MHDFDIINSPVASSLISITGFNQTVILYFSHMTM